MPEFIRTICVVDGIHLDEWCAGQAYENPHWPIPGASREVMNFQDYAAGNKQRLWKGYNLGIVEPEVLPEPMRSHANRIHQNIDNHTLTIAVHGTATDKSYCTYGPNALPEVKGLAYDLGFRIARIEKSCMTRHSNLLTVELVREDSITVDGILRALPDIIAGKPLPQGPLKEYAYVGGIKSEDGLACGLPRQQEGFTPLASDVATKLKERMGLDVNFDLYVSCLDADYYEERSNGYWGELCIPIARTALPLHSFDDLGVDK